MEAFIQHTGLIATLNQANIDTDQIIPKQFLKSIKRTGFGPSLFFDWRYREDASDNPDFALNAPRFEGASILVVRNNFGCGSSREHAVWAVLQYGFRVVVAPWVDRGGSRVPGFADIFRNNAAKNGLLTIELPEASVEEIFQAVEANEGLQATVDLAAQTLKLDGAGHPVYRFEIDPGVKEHLLQGLDDISLTLRHEDRITTFEAQHDTQLPVRT